MSAINKDGTPAKKRGPKPGAKYTPRKQGPSMSDIDDLIGIPSDSPTDKLDIDDVFRGVSLTWLAQAFKMDRVTVKKRLAHCPSIASDRASKLYSLRQAASYLVEPKVDIAAYLKAMRPNDLPPMLQDSFWSAQTKRQKWELEAGNLWRTDDVVQVLGETARRIRTAVTLWADNLDRVHGMSDEQLAMLTAMCDGLLDDIHETLIEMPLQKNTPSLISQMAEMEQDDAARTEDIHAPVSVS